MKRALITGIAGQDGSHLAELLLEKDYEVHGLVRRASIFNRHRIDHLAHDTRESDCRLFLHYGDLSDAVGLVNLIREIVPDEVYHLGAQSHVAVSFEIPDYTSEVTGLGTVRLLEAIHASGIQTRFYQASSSEMFGSAPPPQNEDTPFHPRSPYACAKVFAHHSTVNYREAYGLFAVSGILFNHECVPADTPVVVRRHGILDVVPVGDVVPHRTDPTKGKRYTTDGGDLEVWDGERFARCTARTATWHDEDITRIHGRGGLVDATDDHVVFTQGCGKPAGTIEAGDHLVLADQPPPTLATVVTTEEAWLLGILAAEGYVSETGHGRITCGDDPVLARAADAWTAVAAGYVTKGETRSAFSDNVTPTLELRGNGAYLRMARHELYTRSGSKRVPLRILNSAPDLQEEFLRAYNLGDGLRAGHGVDEFKSFRTSSATLAAGLVWLARTALGRRVSVYWQDGRLGNGSYLINLNSGLTVGNKGAHLRKPQTEVRHTTRYRYTGWMCDLATETERFAAGVGLVVVHNSPRRGENFVTRKVTRAVARIKAGIQDTLYLGNLDAKRDWGYAPEYVEGMWRMLQHSEPDDFVLATGETHSVREFCDAAFAHAGLDWEQYVRTDPRYARPSEVDILCGDASKAKRVLGWEAKVKFAELAQIMVDGDIQLLEDELAGRAVRVD